MVKIVITDKGQSELSFLNFNATELIDQIIKRIPANDVEGISHLYVTDLPRNKDAALGAYFQKFKNKPAYIEIYLKNMFSHITRPDSMSLMLPIKALTLAYTVFHEVGHHLQHTRSHGIKKSKGESFAQAYTLKLYKVFVLDSAEDINTCFDHLEKVATEKNLSLEIIASMKKAGKKNIDIIINKSHNTYKASSCQAQ